MSNADRIEEILDLLRDALHEQLDLQVGDVVDAKCKSPNWDRPKRVPGK